MIELLSSPIVDVTAERRAVLAEAASWIDTPFHHAARVKGVGVDCMQYLIAVYSAVGIIPAIETDYYAADWFVHGRDERILDVIGEYMVAVTDPQPGDVALFRFGRMVAHGAIVTHWPMILHAYRGRPVAFDSADIDGTMATRFASAWTPKRWVTS